MRRFWETVRWLRREQILGRARRLILRPGLPTSPSFKLRPVSGSWQDAAPKRTSFSADGRPTFLNHTGTLTSAADWDNPDEPRLWRYNLHYFDDLLAADAANRHDLHEKLMERWIEENPAPRGTGWEPYPTSLRIVNWIKWSFAGNALSANWQRSLALQAAWLAKNIEWHLLGNHLFANAKALMFAGTYFTGEAADYWRDTGLGILLREAPEQVLPDGGQFERSPMYHALALEDLLDLINLARAYPAAVDASFVADWRAMASRMLDWLESMCHPDGQIALFNDSALGIAADPAALREYALRLGLPAPRAPAAVTHLLDSGYVRASMSHAVLFADIGEIGPDYLPGHAHADTLSFELSLFGQRCIVDPGCSTYDVGAERLRQRGTAAHNTVTVDDEDSSEVWSSFRVARRARPFNVSVSNEGERISIAASHDGYRRLPGKVTHSRQFTLSAGSLEIEDHLDGRYSVAAAGLLLHPDVDVTLDGDGFVLSMRDGRAILDFDGASARVEAATWHPEFGVSVETSQIRVAMTGPRLITKLSWTED